MNKEDVGQRVLAFLLMATACQPATSFADIAPDSLPTPAPRSTFQIEHSVVHTLNSAKLQRSYDVYVKLPPGYDDAANAQRTYPVVYLNDGPYTFTVAAGVSGVPMRHDTFDEFILVGFSYAQGEDSMLSRERDLTPWTDLRNKPYVTGGARAYLDFLEDQAIPFVEKTYRVDPRRRTLAGQSYGALFGIWVLFTEPGLFQNYILTSASLWYNRHAIFASEAAFAAAHTDLKATVYFAIGANEHPAPCGREAAECSNEDMVGDQAAMMKQLRSRHYANLTLHAKVADGAYHTTTFPIGLVWALQDLFLSHRLEHK